MEVKKEIKLENSFQSKEKAEKSFVKITQEIENSINERRLLHVSSEDTNIVFKYYNIHWKEKTRKTKFYFFILYAGILIFLNTMGKNQIVFYPNNLILNEIILSSCLLFGFGGVMMFLFYENNLEKFFLNLEPTLSRKPNYQEIANQTARKIFIKSSFEIKETGIKFATIIGSVFLIYVAISYFSTAQNQNFLVTGFIFFTLFILVQKRNNIVLEFK